MTLNEIKVPALDMSFYDACREGKSFYFDSYYDQAFDQYEMSGHEHAKIELLFVVSGELQVYVDLPKDKRRAGQAKRRDFILKSNEFIFIDRGLRHGLKIESGGPVKTHILNVEFGVLDPKGMPDLPAKDRYDRNFSVVNLDRLMDNSETFSSFVELERPIIHLKDKNRILLSSMTLLLNSLTDPTLTSDDEWLQCTAFCRLLFELAKRQPSSEYHGAKRHVEFAKQFIETNFDRNISVQDIADFVDIHPAYLQRIYRDEVGVTIMNDVNKLRMEKARTLVGDTSLSMEEIAKEVGFNSRQSFSLAFSKFYDMSPQTFRRLSREGSFDLADFTNDEEHQDFEA